MLLEKLREDMKAALKAGEKQRLGVIRMLISELNNASIAASGDLDEAEEQRVLTSYAKKRREVMESARDGGREDLVASEKFEHEVTMSYLPEQLSEADLRVIVEKHVEAVDASGNQAFGQIMKAVMAEVGAGADGKVVSALVREVLA
ncbi:MAG: GatB/YqeY domain-containing protein [Candidatus Krumholzibacteriota bacterium]|nr:GatB/YqeY domain-containing protein [Candidatus Krumholzibacteriota bacterium]